jgi:hypothetical protein
MRLNRHGHHGRRTRRPLSAAAPFPDKLMEWASEPAIRASPVRSTTTPPTLIGDCLRSHAHGAVRSPQSAVRRRILLPLLDATAGTTPFAGIAVTISGPSV